MGTEQKSSGGKSVLVLGASGMLGNAVMRYFSERGVHRVIGSVRSEESKRLLPAALQAKVLIGADVEKADNLSRLFEEAHPQVVINCIGLVKQLEHADDPIAALTVNALLPHKLACLCAIAGARLVHISTDCVFSGERGMYLETDACDAKDLYGRAKYLGEVAYPHTITLRTSMIGHELNSAHALIGWFLSQPGAIRGFAKAVFSGLPTVELARIMHDFVIPNERLSGVYHVSSEPIDKYSLLNKVAEAYGKQIQIARDETTVIDRSLDSSRFKNATGYSPPDWSELIRRMREFG